MIEAPYQCKFCLKGFKLERPFMNHYCKEKKRAEEILTPLGKQAYFCYKTWMELKRFKVPAIETFATSSFYNAFIRFCEFAQKHSIPSVEKYIELMVQKNLSPTIWSSSDAYSYYIEWSDKKSTPLEQAQISVDTILKLSEAANVEPAHLFENLKFGEVTQLIKERKLSPWILLCSKTFKSWLEGLTEQEQLLLVRLVGIDYWALKFSNKPTEVSDMKKIVEELGI